MFAIIGIVVVFGAVLGGYLMEHGNVKVLLQPAELLIIGGAGAGTVLIANPLHILKQIAGGVVVVFKGSSITKQRYIDSLKVTYELLNKARRQGLMSLETDVEEPDKSPIFSKDAEFLKNHHVRYFFCDSMRMAISGVEALELDQLMELDLEVHHHGVSIEGHTDSKPFSGKRNYGNWELSTDRANSARRLMQQQGLGEKQIAQVRGFADQLLRKPENPVDPSNRRISLIVQYTDQGDAQEGRTAETVNKLAESGQK